MEMMRLRPFGQKRKTYFYGVAGFVLAAHVVVGSMIYVMPPELEEAVGDSALGEINVVEFKSIMTDAVIMIEDTAAVEAEPPETFESDWTAESIPPEMEPLPPIESLLPPPVAIEDPEEPIFTDEPISAEEPIGAEEPINTEEPLIAPDPTPTTTHQVKEAQPEKVTPKTPTVTEKKKVQATKPKPRQAPKSTVKKKTPPKQVTKPAPAPVVKQPEPRPEPPRAEPVTPPKRRGLLDKMRNKSSAPAKPKSEPYVAATWQQRPPPYYPYEQRKQGIEGTAHVRVSIDTRGRITSSRLVRSSGNAQLDQAAMISVKKGVLSPARRGERTVASEMLVPFEFYLP